MKLVLCDQNSSLVLAWRKLFAGFKEVEIYEGSIFADHLEYDALVSPANSFGFMDGGFDGIITNVLGPQVQERVQNIIKMNYNGELLVGQAAIIETDNKRIPYVISAPTMRVPTILPKDNINVYLATRAVFIEILQWNVYLQTLSPDTNKAPPVNSVAFTGLGTGVGKIQPLDCATQMFQAYEDVIISNLKFPTTLREASLRHRHILRGK